VVKTPDALAALVNFIGLELAGRPNRCSHTWKDDLGRKRRSHSRTFSSGASVTLPLLWVRAGYTAGTLTDDPHMIVPQGIMHAHVHLNTTTIRTCVGNLDDCATTGRLWRPAGIPASLTG
jgi:hypothetical protein